MATPNVAPKRHAREYETIWVLRPDVDPDGADKVANRVADVITRENGKLVKVETWGRRKLAYDVAKHKRGVYYYVKYVGGGSAVAEIERNLRMLDTVLKFQTVQTKDEVELEAVTVDPEEVKFTRIEAQTEEEAREESREKALGLLEAIEAASAPRAPQETEFAEEPAGESEEAAPASTKEKE
jgi:small subunit ribosomal protein S6